MTDNEIIKALECCKTNLIDDCKRCNLRLEDGTVQPFCTTTLIGNALDLINRQKAKIERLNKEVFAKEQEYVDMQEQRDSVEYNLELIKQEKSVVIAEAIKEFAERLKAKDGYDNHNFDDCASILVPREYREGRDEKISEIWSTIDNLVKEMVGDNDA